MSISPSDNPFQRGLFISDSLAAVPATVGAAVEPDQPASAQARRQELADELGESVERIRIVRPDWQALTRRVVAVDLTIGYPRFRHRLTGSDLGLSQVQKNDPEYAEALAEVATLGNKRLLPDHTRQLEVVEGQARYSLEKVSLHSGFGHLVPRRVYPELRERLQQLRDDFFGISDEMLAGYDDDQLRQDILDRFRRIGRGALAQLRASGAVIPDDEDWIENYAQRHLALLPPREEVERAFTFEWVPKYLAPAAEIAEDQALAEKRRLESQIEGDLLRLKERNIRYQEDFDYQQKQLELDTVRRERQREEELAREVQQARKQKQLELVDGTFREIGSQLREAVYDVCLDVLDSMQRKGRVVRNSSRQLHGLVDRLRLLNVCDDGEIEAITRQMEAILQSNAKRRDPRAITEVLTEIGTLARAQLVAAGRMPRSGLDLQIPDVVDQTRRSAAARRLATTVSASTFELPAIGRVGRRISAPPEPLPLSA